MTADDVFVGMEALILKGVTIGEGAVVGAGAVVTQDVPPRTGGGATRPRSSAPFPDSGMESGRRFRWEGPTVLPAPRMWGAYLCTDQQRHALMRQHRASSRKELR